MSSWFYLNSNDVLDNTASDVMSIDSDDYLNFDSNTVALNNSQIAFNQNSLITDSIIGRRMLDYYPYCVQIIVDFQTIIASEYPEFEITRVAVQSVLNNAFLLLMSEERIEEWEKALDMISDSTDTLEDRRSAVIARIRGFTKLNTASIKSIVNAVTGGGEVTSYVENSVLHVLISPPEGNRMYKFATIEAELMRRKPAHLGLNVRRTYQTWGDVNTNCATWQVESDTYNTWNDTMYDIEN